MTKIRIIEKAKNAMQSGKAGTGVWYLEFETNDGQRADPLMGWAGSSDTNRQLNLKFPTLEAAQAYAKKRGFDCVVVPSAPKRLKLQAYADNFR